MLLLLLMLTCLSLPLTAAQYEKKDDKQKKNLREMGYSFVVELPPSNSEITYSRLPPLLCGALHYSTSTDITVDRLYKNDKQKYARDTQELDMVQALKLRKSTMDSYARLQEYFGFSHADPVCLNPVSGLFKPSSLQSDEVSVAQHKAQWRMFNQLALDTVSKTMPGFSEDKEFRVLFASVKVCKQDFIVCTSHTALKFIQTQPAGLYAQRRARIQGIKLFWQLMPKKQRQEWLKKLPSLHTS